jgi:hypothetical protein
MTMSDLNSYCMVPAACDVLTGDTESVGGSGAVIHLNRAAISGAIEEPGGGVDSNQSEHEQILLIFDEISILS